MTGTTIEQLCGAVSADTMMAHLGGVCETREAVGNARGTGELSLPASRCLDGYGYATDLISPPAYISLPGAARVEIGNEDRRAASRIRSPARPQRRNARRVVYAGAGTRARSSRAIDVRGKIVLLDGDRQLRRPACAASKAGAIGQIHISPHEHLHEMCISPVWGSPTDGDRRERLPTHRRRHASRKEDGDALQGARAGGRERRSGAARRGRHRLAQDADPGRRMSMPERRGRTSRS